MKLWFLSFIVCLGLTSGFENARAAQAATLSYNRDVRAILSDNCFACHGPDSANRQAGLRLDVREAAVAPSSSAGPAAIVPGKPNESELIARILSDDVDTMMPPPKSHKKLSAAQKDILRRWITEGASYEKHWAYLPVGPVSVPTAADLPTTIDPAWKMWPRNPIDWFILRRLSEAGLKPSPPAKAATLARRIALDLTGLPPRADLQAEFDAENLVDYIDAHFSTPHYGERMAVDWLDAARYADTQGYQVDRDQDMHAYRDWVIGAFNQNMPFDRFTVEQLAGDLLPNATAEQKIATGFHRNHMVNQEGGAIAAEFIAEYGADRVETTAAVWMGQTFNCARCHDHKFDAITQRDFYALKAFFATVGEHGDGGQDSLPLPMPAIDGRLAPLASELAALQKQTVTPKIDEAKFARWIERVVKEPPVWKPLEIVAVAAEQGDPKPAEDGRSFGLGRVNRGSRPVTLSVRIPVGFSATALRLECTADVADAAVSLDRAFLGPSKKPLVMHGAVEGVSSKAADAEKLLKAGRNNVTLDPDPRKPPAALVWELDVPLTAAAAGGQFEFAITVFSSEHETRWRLLATDAPTDQFVAQATLDLAAKDPASRNAASNAPSSKNVAELRGLERVALRRAYQATLGESKLVNRKIAEIKAQFDALEAQRPRAIVMQERIKPKETFILMRGVYDKPGERVTAATPAVMPPLASDAPRNRLGLARWLVDGKHPLTARMTVNRLWQSIFGVGLVRTSEDFGSQGEAPSHPELLDWLAGEFVRSGWNVRHMQRLMLTSATYRQTSRVTPELLAADPDNRLVGRGPRFRLNAEFVRDQALAAAGLLSERIGGKSVKPYHPPGLYELVTAGSSTNTWVEDTGESLHRRSMYTYWKRSVPHPAMLAFDAPGREVCALRRPRSNTPLQALNLMNDPAYVEAARHLAARMLKAGSDVKSQIGFGYRTLLARDPTDAELAILTRAFERNRTAFAARPEAAAGLLKTGVPVADKNLDPAVLAAMTGVASTMLCLDETVTKE
jgi:hypothetical protein